MFVGLVAAAAAAGALVRIGHRIGDIWRPVNAVAAYGVGAGAQSVAGFDAILALLGAVIHLTALGVAGISTVGLLRRWRLRPIGAGILVSTALLALSIGSAMFAGIGLAAVLPIGDVLLVHVVIALGLWGGTRFALLIPRQNARSTAP
jgi:hypothetical protein